MPKVSVIIPVYNMERFIGACLDSVLNQTFSDFECICINDGSTDGTLQILKQYEQKDSRIKLIDQANQGGSAARNVGLNVAQGEWISFLDNDDLYHPQYLEILLGYAEKYGADISVCNYGVFFNDDPVNFETYNAQQLKKPKLITSKPFYDYVVRKKKIHMLMWTKLYKKEILENIRFALALPAINDILFNLETLSASKKVVTCPYTLITHRILQTSQTSSKVTPKKILEYKDLIYAVERSFEHKDLTQKERKSLKIFNTKNAFYNFVYLMVKFNDLSQNAEVYHSILETLDQLEGEGLILPSKLKFQDKMLYNAFKSGNLRRVKSVMRFRDLFTH